MADRIQLVTRVFNWENNWQNIPRVNTILLKLNRGSIERDRVR